MTPKLLLPLCALLLLSGCSSFDKIVHPPKTGEGDCPRADLGETLWDCPWAGMVRRSTLHLGNGPSTDLVVFQDEYKRKVGFYARAAAVEAKDQGGWKELWGQALLLDRKTGKRWVEPKLAEWILGQLGEHKPLVHPPTVNAGLLLTMLGVWSTLRTPWNQGEVEQGLGLPPNSISPRAQAGTWFSNLTWVLARLVMFDEPEIEKKLWSGYARVDERIPALRWGWDKITRLKSKLQLPGGAVAVLQTDWVPFRKPTVSGRFKYLKIVSLKTASSPHSVLQWAEPVSAQEREQVLTDVQKGRKLEEKWFLDRWTRIPGVDPSRVEFVAEHEVVERVL